MLKYFCDTCGKEMKLPEDMRKLRMVDTNEKPVIPEKVICIPCKEIIVKTINDLGEKK